MTSTPARQPRALVLDADAERARDVGRSLEARRFAVLSANDGTSGLALLLDELLDLDVLVVAADLPHRDARSFAHLIRRAGGERDLALVVLAEDATPAVRAELLALDVDAVLDASAGADALADAVLDVVRGGERAGEDAIPATRASPAAPAAAPGPGERWVLACCGPLPA